MSEVAVGAQRSGSRSPRGQELDPQLEKYRRELTGYCYRMLGGAFEAEDAVQETMVRAWRSLGSFEGRASLRSWLYKIATNVCYDMLNRRQRRAQPMDLGPSSTADTPVGTPLTEVTWLEPVPTSRVVTTEADPAEQVVSNESVRLAFVAALQHLPARQRAVLILRQVLRWRASEVAELLDTSVASVNSALQRARATLAASDLEASEPVRADDEEQQALLARYVEAFEQFDIDSLVSLLHEDAGFSMPPYALWLQGTSEIARWYVGQGADCRGSRMVPVEANGQPAFAQYKPAGEARLTPWAIHVVEMSAGRIVHIHHFLDLDGKLFPRFGLPLELTR